MFSVNFGHSCEISKNTFFHRTPLVAAFVPQLLSCEFEDYSKENILNEMRLLKHLKSFSWSAQSLQKTSGRLLLKIF